MRPARTVLEQKIRERRMTLEEFAEYVELFAREHNEPGTLGLRHLKRLIAGRRPDGQPLSPLRPATARLLENIFGISVDELLSQPPTLPELDDSAAELSQMLHASGRVDKPMVALLREQLSNVRRIDRQLGAIVTYEEVKSKAEQVGRLLTYSLSADTRQPLAALLSELNTLAGWQALDLGKIGAAWQHYEHAKSAARESSSASFEIYAVGEQAFALLDAGETESAAEILTSANEASKRTCPAHLRAWLAAAHGETLAANGQHDASLRSFDLAADLLSVDWSDFEGPYVVLDAIHLARWRGHALAKFADTEAVSLLTDALQRLDPSFTRAETALRTDLAIALTTHGDHLEALKLAKHATQLAAQIGSARQFRRADKLTKSI